MAVWRARAQGGIADHGDFFGQGDDGDRHAQSFDGLAEGAGGETDHMQLGLGQGLLHHGDDIQQIAFAAAQFAHGVHKDDAKFAAQFAQRQQFGGWIGCDNILQLRFGRRFLFGVLRQELCLYLVENGKDFGAHAVAIETCDHRLAGAGRNVLAQVGIFNQRLHDVAQIDGIAGGEAQGILAMGKQFGRAAGARDNHGPAAGHAFGDGQAEGFGQGAGVDDDIQGAVHGGGIFLETDEADVWGDAQIRGQLAQLFEGELRAAGGVDGATDDEESHIGGGFIFEIGGGRLQKKILSFPVGISGNDADPDHIGRGGGQAGQFLQGGAFIGAGRKCFHIHAVVNDVHGRFLKHFAGIFSHGLGDGDDGRDAAGGHVNDARHYGADGKEVTQVPHHRGVGPAQQPA